LANVRNNVKKRAFEPEEEYGRERCEFVEQQKLLGEWESESFQCDVVRWIQDNDEGYAHRMYDYGKVFTNPDEFIRDVTDKLVGLEGLSGKDADTIAHGLYDEFLSRPVGRKSATVISLRGAEKGRTFQFRSDVVENWLGTDARRMAKPWLDTIIRDALLQKEIGAFEGHIFEREIKDQVVAPVDSWIF
jgi:hypothetical protein